MIKLGPTPCALCFPWKTVFLKRLREMAVQLPFPLPLKAHSVGAHVKADLEKDIVVWVARKH